MKVRIQRGDADGSWVLLNPHTDKPYCQCESRDAALWLMDLIAAEPEPDTTVSVRVQMYGYWTNPQRGPMEFLGTRFVEGCPGDALEIPVHADRIVRRIVLSVTHPEGGA